MFGWRIERNALLSLAEILLDGNRHWTVCKKSLVIYFDCQMNIARYSAVPNSTLLQGKLLCVLCRDNIPHGNLTIRFYRYWPLALNIHPMRRLSSQKKKLIIGCGMLSTCIPGRWSLMGTYYIIVRIQLRVTSIASYNPMIACKW